MSDTEDTGTHEFRIKCRNCGLHYAVFSWNEKWGEGDAEGGYCPECGKGGTKLVWGPVNHDEPIFHFIPGEAGGGVKIENGEQVVVEGKEMRFTGPVAESAFGIPRRMSEPQ